MVMWIIQKFLMQLFEPEQKVELEFLGDMAMQRSHLLKLQYLLKISRGSWRAYSLLLVRRELTSKTFESSMCWANQADLLNFPFSRKQRRISFRR